MKLLLRGQGIIPDLRIGVRHVRAGIGKQDGDREIDRELPDGRGRDQVRFVVSGPRLVEGFARIQAPGQSRPDSLRTRRNEPVPMANPGLKQPLATPSS